MVPFEGAACRVGRSRFLQPLLPEYSVFRAPFLQSPIPGQRATLPVLMTETRMLVNFADH